MSLPVLPTQRLPFSGFARKRRQRGRASTEGFSLLSHCACASKGRDPCMAHGRTLMSGDAQSLHSLGATQQPRQESRHMLGGTLAPNRLLSFFSSFLCCSFFISLSLSFQSHHRLENMISGISVRTTRKASSVRPERPGGRPEPRGAWQAIAVQTSVGAPGRRAPAPPQRKGVSQNGVCLSTSYPGRKLHLCF